MFTFGGWLNFLSVIQSTVQVIILRKNCKVVEIVIQTILAFAYGYLTNFSCHLIRNLNVNNYIGQLVFLGWQAGILGSSSAEMKALSPIVCENDIGE